MIRTGCHYKFRVEYFQPTGKVARSTETVIALNKAGAWAQVGRLIHDFMNGPDGREIIAVRMIQS